MHSLMPIAAHRSPQDEPDGTDHIGTIAQQVEDSPLKNAVVDTPQGKALDTAELSASYWSTRS